MITVDDLRDFGTSFFDAVASGASAAEQAQFFLDPHARIYVAWNGATISLKDHETLHAQWINEHHAFGHFDLTPLNASPERVRARGTVYWQAEFPGRPPPNVIKAVVGEDWILERAASGELKFVLYLNTFHHFLPESAPLDFDRMRPGSPVQGGYLMPEIILAALLGLATTSSAMVGVALGLYVPISKRLLGCILAFASGGLISALAIELAFNGAIQLHHQGFGLGASWSLVGSGFAIGATIYSVFTRYLEQKGAAVRYPTRFREFVEKRRERDAKELIALLSRCDLLRHLPPEEIEVILPCVHTRRLGPGQILFSAGDPGDALYIVASGKVEILEGDQPIASLGEGEAFGEMALLSGSSRTATVRAAGDVGLLEIGRKDFERLLAEDQVLARAVERLSHDRALTNLSAGTPGAASWATVASSSLERTTQREANKILAEGGHGSGIPIVLGNVLDTIPGCLVIGSTFHGWGTLSLSLMLGVFIGNIPEAAASAATLRRAGYRAPTIFGLWSTVLVAGTLAAAAGNGLIGGSYPLVTVFCEAVAGGAVLALVTHAMIPEAIDEAGSLIVLPTTAGFLAALYLALAEHSA